MKRESVCYRKTSRGLIYMLSSVPEERGVKKKILEVIMIKNFTNFLKIK